MLARSFALGLGLALAGPAARPALAVQAHGGAEGLVSHQVSHLLFVAGMLFVLTRLLGSGFSGPGWRQFKGFVWTVVVWNVMTFTGHWLQEYVDAARFSRSEGLTLSFTIGSLSDGLFYVTSLDHLVLVPSFLLLLAALRRWRRTS